MIDAKPRGLLPVCCDSLNALCFFAGFLTVERSLARYRTRPVGDRPRRRAGGECAARSARTRDTRNRPIELLQPEAYQSGGRGFPSSWAMRATYRGPHDSRSWSTSCP